MRDIIIHGHFYQPPRQDPWLELVPHEPSAAPDHDWNERITAECYRPLSRAPVVDEHGRVVRVINAYAWCSYDVGPTLFRWLDAHAAAVRDAIVAGDRESRERLGAGNAMAMPYHHVILPLLSRRDKITEIRWGIRDFRTRFGREPDGMWLPETAADDETLAVLVDERIRLTVLAPNQVSGAPAFGRAGRWRGTGGRELAIFTYDGPAAHHVAFGDALEDAGRWEANLAGYPLAADGGPNVVSLATDGETFGHHHRLGDLSLAALIDRLDHRHDTTLTNFAAILDAYPPMEDVTIVSPSSWSCPHGVDRWRRECGCRFEPGTSQAWRVPLRDGLETLAAGINACVERLWPAAAGDVWTARDVAGPDLAGAPQLPADARRLLEVERHLLAAFTSCAWFFDDLGRLEPRIVMGHAARALDLLPPADRAPLEAALLATLAQAHSNDSAKGTGAEIWYRDVRPEAQGPARLAAGLAALRDLSPDGLDDVVMPAHTWRIDGDDIVVQHRRTSRECRWHAEPITVGVLAIRTHIRAVPPPNPTIVGIGDYPEPIRQALREIATPLILAAALSAADATLLHGGVLEPAVARCRALAGAWKLIERDGLDDAAVVLHGVLDLFDLESLAVSDDARTDAFVRLAAFPTSHVRDALAERFGLAMRGAAR
ncbi:MAG: DUF3536 domain-containing protein [Gemmatimonadales bacterium]